MLRLGNPQPQLSVKVKTMSIGGRASNNGVSFVSDDYAAKFVMRKDGGYDISIEKLKDISKLRKTMKKIPLVKGLFSVLTGGRVVVAIIILSIISDFSDFSESVGNTSAHSLLFGITAVGIAVCLIYIFKTIIIKAKETWRFHGAEHKTIYADENGIELTLENVRACPRVAERCGTNFGVFFILFCIIFNIFIAYNSVTLIISYIFAYEVFDLDRGEKLPVIKWLFKLGGFFQQKLLTAEPTDAQLLAAIETMKKLKSL